MNHDWLMFQLLKMKIVVGIVALLSVGMVHGLTQGMISAVNLDFA